MPTVYFDESANSGENLLDLQQPVFALAAVCLNEKDATDIIRTALAPLPPRQGEPKYSSLARSPAGREALLTALESLPEDTTFTFLAHKRFMTVAKMVDLLAVELAYDNGYDMYADGSAVALANFIYMAGPVLGDSAAFEHMLTTFVGALRPSQSVTLDDLFAAISAYRATTIDDFGDYIYLLEGARDQAESLARSIEERMVRDELDPAIPCLLTLCHGVSAKTGPFSIVHDESKTIARHIPHLMTLDRLPPVTPRQPPMALPVTDIAFADSATTPPLQIADWVAGASRQAGQFSATEQGGAFAERLTPLVESWMVDSLWPNPDLIGTPRVL